MTAPSYNGGSAKESRARLRLLVRATANDAGRRHPRNSSLVKKSSRSAQRKTQALSLSLSALSLPFFLSLSSIAVWETFAPKMISLFISHASSSIFSPPSNVRMSFQREESCTGWIANLQRGVSRRLVFCSLLSFCSSYLVRDRKNECSVIAKGVVRGTIDLEWKVLCSSCFNFNCTHIDSSP